MESNVEMSQQNYAVGTYNCRYNLSIKYTCIYTEKNMNDYTNTITQILYLIYTVANHVSFNVEYSKSRYIKHQGVCICLP